MICKPCREAAVLARGTEEIICQDLYSGTQQVLAPDQAAAWMHGQCQEARRRSGRLTAVELAGSAWCDCQHVIPVRSRDVALTLD